MLPNTSCSKCMIQVQAETLGCHQTDIQQNPSLGGLDWEAEDL